MTDRYYVDKRVGCVAVRDRTKECPESRCLDPDMEDVVHFWSFGRVEKQCPTCGHTTYDWAAGQGPVTAAHAMASALNGAEAIRRRARGQEAEREDA
jgi:hypothetical protein